MNPNFLPSGHLLHQRYSIQQSLGQGGFGITYLAYDTKLEKEVCVKELFIAGNSTRGADMTVNSQSIQGFSFEDFVNRFVEEARKQAQFDHPNIVRVFDVFHSNATAYMVMEYVKGETLKQKVQKEGALSEHVAMKLIDQLLNGVEEVHKKGMLHRDIKPDNILITDEGKLVLIDFGSAREFSDGKTITHTAMLTPGYAPMEQYSDRAQRGPYTDIYALGATIYFSLTGEKPLAVTDRSFEELASPHVINHDISSQLASAVMLAMELKPENRFQSIPEIRKALESLQGDSEIEKGEEVVPIENPDPIENEKLEEKPKSLDDMFILAGVVIFLTVGIFLSRNPSTEAILTGNTNGIELNTIENQSDSLTGEGTEPSEGNIDSGISNQLERQTQAKKDSKEKTKEYGTLSDIQGNQYQTVRIGNQVWMAENLNVDRFRNGDRIPEAKTPEEWKRVGENGDPAWSYYQNYTSNGVKYGKLYNWYAVNDPRGLAPKGWHIPSDPEWTALTDYLGREDAAGSRMKSTSGWEENGNGTNESGFSGLPGGFRDYDGEFDAIGGLGSWWSSSEDDVDYAWLRFLYYGDDSIGRYHQIDKAKGFSVRSLRD